MDAPKNVNSEVQGSMLPHQILFWEVIEAKQRGEIDQIEDDSESNNNSKDDDWDDWYE